MAPQMQQQDQDQQMAPQPRVRWAHHIATRDGTLTKDAKMVNCFLEVSEGGKDAVSRPGLVLFRALPQGTAQGQFLCNGAAYSIVNDSIYNSNSGVLVAAIPTPGTAGLHYDVLSDVPQGTTFLKNAKGLWSFNGTTVTKVTDVNYPTDTVPGLAYLDGRYYVMDPTGTVRGSDLQNGNSWPALNFIGADATLGVGIGLARHLNYIIAFYAQGTQFYYDAALSPGLPLAPVGNASWTTGCATGDSVVEIADMTNFIGRNAQHGRTVQQYTGLQMAQISNPYIEKILNRSTLVGVKAFGIKTAGHTFYLLTMPDISTTLCYDLLMSEWYVWSSVVGGNEQYFVGAHYVTDGTNDLLQDLTTGSVLKLDPTAYADASGPLSMRCVTPQYDWGSMKRKRFSAGSLIADTQSTTVQLRYSDDDYQTFSAYRTVDLSTVRKQLQRMGSSRRRAWELLHTDNAPCRVREFLLDMTVGGN